LERDSRSGKRKVQSGKKKFEPDVLSSIQRF
jgi:hypothetical protein